MYQDGYVWILGPGSFRVIGLHDFHMQTSIVLLTNEYDASTVHVHNIPSIKIEPNDVDVLVLLDSDEDVYPIVDLFDTSPFPYKIEPSNPVLVAVNVDRTPHNLSYMKLVRHGSSSQRPPLHPPSSSSCFNIVIALKMTKSRRGLNMILLQLILTL